MDWLIPRPDVPLGRSGGAAGAYVLRDFHGVIWAKLPIVPIQLEVEAVIRCPALEQPLKVDFDYLIGVVDLRPPRLGRGRVQFKGFRSVQQVEYLADYWHGWSASPAQASCITGPRPPRSYPRS